MGTEKEMLEKDAVRAKLKSTDGRTYWKGLEELAETNEFTKWLEDEFPERKSLLEVDRRSMLKFMGAGLALASLAGCRPLPQERVIPFVKEPENRPPGTSQFYATAYPFGGFGFPVLVESHEGRPTKFEGNPDHPASGGSTDIFTQAAILSMYDPDRLQDVTNQGLPDTYDNFYARMRSVLDTMRQGGGAGIHFLTGTVTSPTLARMIEKFLVEFPKASWHQYEPAGNENSRAGTKMAFGEWAEPLYDFSKAMTVLSLDGDFLAGNPTTVQYAKDFAKNRDLGGTIARLYSVESTPSLTGAYADHRVPVSPNDVYAVAAAVASALGVPVAGAKLPANVSQKWVDSLVADLRRGGLVYPGAHQPAEVHALAHAINSKIGAPVSYVEPAEARPCLHTESFGDLVKAMGRYQVQMLLNFGVNFAYNAPTDLKFAEGLARVQHTIYIGNYADETSKLATWVVPQAHFLESWGDARWLDGTATIMQPLIEPMYGAHSAIEIVARLLKDTRSGEQIVRETWSSLGGKVQWEKTLNDGFVAGTASPQKAVAVSLGAMKAPAAATGTVAVIVPDPTIWDGSFANNGWLQELPKPLTKLVWDNAVHMSPKMAEELGVNYQDLVSVTANGQSVEAPVFIQPGHPETSVTLHMGYGRTEGGKVLKGCGFDFMKLRTSKQPHIVPVEVAKAAGTYELASAQLHHSMEGRDIIREGSLSAYKADPTLKPEDAHELPEASLYNLTEEWAKSGYPQWGMAIDLNLCIGCNVCAIACQAENNIPTVGKQEVARGRELHWIRIDRYYRVKDGSKAEDVITGAAEGGWPLESPVQGGRLSSKTQAGAMDSGKIETVFMPVACMHCETAPCEPVCPVAATVHSHEGLNQMVYNRCVGTRYCSNNCPYKVRRFNYYNYQHGQRDIGSNKDYGQRNFQGEKDRPLLRLLHNPDVTVRSRGVMEKCTFCVQRINEARIDAKKEGREIKDGDIVTACQQACPTRAITFGNIADPQSAVSQKKAEKRNYGLLTELNTKPRTSYLGKVRNPNPELENA